MNIIIEPKNEESERKELESKRRICIVKFVFLALFALIIFYPLTIEPQGYSDDNVYSRLSYLKGAAMMFSKSCEEDGLDMIKPSLDILSEYYDDNKYTRMKREYLFEENNGKWWVGYNLTSIDKTPEQFANEVRIFKLLGSKAIFGSMDDNILYNGEDIVYMRVR